MIDLTEDKIPPGQQVVANSKWPIIGERKPAVTDKPWQLSIGGLVDQDISFQTAQLNALPQTELKIDIHCVTRWSRPAVSFGGVLLSELLNQCGVANDAQYLSFVSRSERRHSSSLPIDVAFAQKTLIALRVDGRDLETEHGGPIRNIVPGRYFYKSVKWLEQIEVLEEDRLGFWEAETGYHNNADPWLEERYMAPTIDRRTAIKLIESRDFSQRDLRSIDASHRDLAGLNAKGSLLRDADFRKSNLTQADFSDANLSNAHFEDADLRGAKFIGTDLEGANLSGADLRNALFQDCSLIGASFFQAERDGTSKQARFDDKTALPSELLNPLTPEQLQFVTAQQSAC